MISEARWKTLEAGKGFIRVDEEHPLDFYIGMDSTGERVLLLVSDESTEVQNQTQVIQVNCKQRNDSRWALTFRLTRPELSRIFSHLCEDLVEFGRNTASVSDAAKTTMKRFLQWQRLLEKSTSGLLDESSLRGLIGELIFFENIALPAYGNVPALEGWVGPLDAEQDFRYSDAVFEIKTIYPNSMHVKISSAEQLEDIGSQLYLVTISLNSSDKTGDRSFCMLELISRLRDRFEKDVTASRLFEERLIAAGYIDHEEYAKHFFQFTGIRKFAVAGNFPRITRSSLTDGIGRVSYEVEIPFLQQFEAEE